MCLCVDLTEKRTPALLKERGPLFRILAVSRWDVAIAGSESVVTCLGMHAVTAHVSDPRQTSDYICTWPSCCKRAGGYKPV